MAEEQTIKNNKPEEKSKIWTEEDGVVNIRIAKVVTEEDVDELIEQTRESLKSFSGRAKILIDMTAINVTAGIRSSGFRKKAAVQAKALIESPGFKKAALFGGATIHRTIASFIIVASGIKNIRMFETKEKALKWLKQP